MCGCNLTSGTGASAPGMGDGGNVSSILNAAGIKFSSFGICLKCLCFWVAVTAVILLWYRKN